jgi:hypothetical protein
MMGRLKGEQAQLFYQFELDDAVPEDHLLRKIDAALDLCWLRGELAPHYSSTGRPSIDPELMIRMLVVGTAILDLGVRIATLALQHRIPIISTNSEITGVGGLISYGVSRRDSFRRSAYFVKKVLDGVKPADVVADQV